MAGHDTPTQPGWVSAPLRKEKKQVPWWATALVTGAGIGITLITAFGLNAAKGAEAQQQPPHVQATSVAPAPNEDSAFRTEVRNALADMRERLARIEGRMERGR